MQLPSGAAPGAPDAALEEAAANEDASPAPSAARRGPGKPLMPLRRSKRKATREEAENAEAWWVRKG